MIPLTMVTTRAIRARAEGTGRHRLQTVRKACTLLKAFTDEEERLTLVEISSRTKIEKTIVFRLVHTLEEEGFLRKVDARSFCLNVRLMSQNRFRLGYAAQSSDSPFSAAVSDSLRRAARKNNVDLIQVDNRYSARAALKAAERLIAERVDIAIEFQTYARVAPLISALFQTAGVPLIAVEIPHPGATFYGVDNYNVGRLAGKALVRWVKKNWQGKADQLLLLGLDIAGPLPHLRLSGAETAIREILPAIPAISLDTRGEFHHSLETIRKHLRLKSASKTLIVGVNDPAVLGALRAFEEAGRSEHCVAVGLGAIPEARAELRRPGSRLIGSIAFFPEHYGEDLLRLAMDILHKQHVPPAVYAKHQMVTPQLANQLYPMDNCDADSGCEIR
jgi:ribose transport system substrate-binding protein